MPKNPYPVGGAANTAEPALPKAVLLGLQQKQAIINQVIEGRLAKAPLVPLRVFRSRQLSAANVVMFLLGASSFAMWYFVSLYLQEVRGFSPIETGLAILPMALSVAVGAQIAGKGTARIGAGPILALGMALVGVGMLLFGRIVQASGTAAI